MEIDKMTMAEFANELNSVAERDHRLYLKQVCAGPARTHYEG